MDFNEVTILLSGAAALAGVIAAFFAILNWWEARSASSDVRRLAELTESSVEEARAQVPDPWVRFLVGRTPAEGFAIRPGPSLGRSFDRDAIVKQELAKRRERVPKADPQIAALRKLGLEFGNPPISPEEQLEQYGRALAEWLDECDAYRREIRYLVWGHVAFGNNGRVPARGLRVRLQFPTDWEWLDEFPERPPKPPNPPGRRGASFFGSPPYSFNPSALLSPSSRPNVRGPWDEGQGIVEYAIDQILHGLPDDSGDPFILRSPSAGEFSVAWAIHAENLTEAKTGELSIRIEAHEVLDDPITRLEDIPEYWTDNDGGDDYIGRPPPTE